MRWFTSDLHFGHANIIRFCDRPFDDTKTMNEAICRNINNSVTPDDELWILGDFAMGQIDQTLLYVERFTAGRVVLVPGNHDRCHPMGKRVEYWLGRYEKAGFTVAEHNLELALTDSFTVNVSHFPYKANAFSFEDRSGMSSFVSKGDGDSGHVDRFVEWQLDDDGRWLLCGHVHEKWRNRNKQINVGIDAWGGLPVSEAQLIEVIADGPSNNDITKWVTPWMK